MRTGVTARKKRKSTGAIEGGVMQPKREAVIATLANGLPPMPAHQLRLMALLAANPVDLRQVASAIRADRRLAARLLQLANGIQTGQQRRVKRVEEATILMGTERLRKLVFSGYLTQLSGKRLAESATMDFWTHSLATAMLSERVARSVGYDRPERAYQCGLLHDMGKLPLLMVAASENSVAPEWLEHDDPGALALERQNFGLDHCQAGRGLAVSWDFDPGQIEVLEFHHNPRRARFDPELVGIVAVADHFCQLAEAGPAGWDCQPAVPDDFYRSCLPGLSERELADLLALLDREYPLVRHQLEFPPTEPGEQAPVCLENERQPA
ncbi:MAG TPA: HDOD domain-containing protein [Candidatus Acidoferrales bacterium]|nr:HDOD domain-containing protein [Candidatus Acidoferrales bacterium]